MDLTTTYMGMKLKNPLIPSASPMSDDLGKLREMEDAGAAAVVLHSLFEEQLRTDRAELFHSMTQGTESFPEALSYFPEPPSFQLGPEEYLEHIRKAKTAVKIPIIASLNGSSVGGWTDYAKKIQQAGADALELNIYFIPTDLTMSGAVVEERTLDIVRAVKSAVTFPVAVKCSPFFSNMANMAYQLDAVGADALVFFNRFYQPDIDLEDLEIRPNVLLSTPQAARLPLTWIGILYGRIRAYLAATSGVHSGLDALKMLMVGASVTQVTSALYKHGIGHLKVMEREMIDWMEKHEYESVQQMRGSMSQMNCHDPAAFERAQYMRAISKPISTTPSPL
jgi:dihydroorotate dehydrogenase (fumarate)